MKRRRATKSPTNKYSAEHMHNLQLIESIQKRPILWDTININSDSDKHTTATKTAWNDISNQLGLTSKPVCNSEIFKNNFKYIF